MSIVICIINAVCTTVQNRPSRFATKGAVLDDHPMMVLHACLVVVGAATTIYSSNTIIIVLDGIDTAKEFTTID